MSKYKVGDAVYCDKVSRFMVWVEVATVVAVCPKKRFLRQMYLIQRDDTLLYKVDEYQLIKVTEVKA
jgi:hypothetical protein